MTDTATKVREHYSATALTDRIKLALATITPEGQTLSVEAAGHKSVAISPRHAHMDETTLRNAMPVLNGKRVPSA